MSLFICLWHNTLPRRERENQKILSWRWTTEAEMVRKTILERCQKWIPLPLTSRHLPHRKITTPRQPSRCFCQYTQTRHYFTSNNHINSKRAIPPVLIFVRHLIFSRNQKPNVSFCDWGRDKLQIFPILI